MIARKNVIRDPPDIEVGTLPTDLIQTNQFELKIYNLI